MKTKIRRFLSVVAIVMIVFLVVAGVFVGIYVTKGVNGLLHIPGISTILGFDHPKDLDMGSVTDADRTSLLEKLGADPASWQSGSGARTPLQVSLTPREAAAFLATGQGSDIFYDVQILVKEDGTIGISCMMKVDGALAIGNMKREDIERSFGALPDEVPVYLEVTATPVDGSLGIYVRQMKVGSVTIPGSSLGIDNASMDYYVRKFFLDTYGAELVSIAAQGGQLVLDLKVPAA